MANVLSKFAACFAVALLPLAASAQVNSGSNGSDGALNPTSNLVIDMADHPDGIYHYTSVNIQAGVTVSFIPNAGNKPVVWLVQGECAITGTVDVSGKPAIAGVGGVAGPGGWAGGNGGNNDNLASYGMGPGGGTPGIDDNAGIYFGGNGSFGTKGNVVGQQKLAGETYGNIFLLPLMGGSGGGGSAGFNSGGAGGGGAILIACSGSIVLNGLIAANGGGGTVWPSLGDGSGGGVRLVASTITGNGHVAADGGTTPQSSSKGGQGRVRFDAFQNSFGGTVLGVSTRGFQPIILPAAGQGVQLSISSIGGAAVAANPFGVLANPDVIIPAQQANPVPIVIQCTNLPLNTEITVIVKPANGAEVQVVGLNNTGTTTASSATIPVNMPRGGGIIYARAVTGTAGGNASLEAGEKNRSVAETGWTADGERFSAMEITAALGGQQRVAYITASGKRYPSP